MSQDSSFVLQGGCGCGAVRYQINREPLIVHACHCSYCQKETGSAFVLNAMVETDQVEWVEGEPEAIDTPSASGRGQLIFRCPTCRVAVASQYGSRRLRFMRVGTLDDPNQCPPDVHIFTSTKQRWLALPETAKVFDDFYDVPSVWPASSLERYQTLFGK